MVKLIIKNYMNNLFGKSEIRFYTLVLFISIVLAVLNNIRVSDDKSVSWFGGQTILEKPDGY